MQETLSLPPWSAKSRQSGNERSQTRYSAAIDAAVSQARAMQERVTVETQDGGEAYAYPHQRGIAWGVEA